MVPAVIMESFMQYMLLAYTDESGFQTLTPEQRTAGLVAYGAFTEALKKE
jgi:hypothetical protein